MADESITEAVKEPAKRRRRCGKGPFFLIVIMILIVCAFGYGYFQLARVNLSLAQSLTGLQKQSETQQEAITALQTTVTGLGEAEQKSQALVTQQEQLMSEWKAAQKGDLSKWHVAEAQYLVRLANDTLQFEHNSVLALVLLKRAEQIMQSLQDPALLELQKSLAADIANVQATPEINMTSLYVELSGLDAQVDQLPLPINPLKENTATTTTPAAIPAGQSWWRTGLDRSWQALSKIVIVRYNGANALPLVLPEEKIFLYQNLHAQLEGAMWGVLHRNAEVYQASLARAISWVEHYFVQEAPATQHVLASLKNLRAVNIQPSVINLSATLQLFEGYFAKAAEVQQVQ
jgi:uroporphyrin-III C-methyltransferase